MVGSRRNLILPALALVAGAFLAASAGAEHETSGGETQCGYASSGNTHVVAGPNGPTAYAGANSSEPGAQNGTAAGVCSGSDSIPVDGIVEVRTQSGCAYAVADPSNAPDPSIEDRWVKVDTCGFTGVGSDGNHHD